MRGKGITRPGFKRIVRVDRHLPDQKHDTRILECGHSKVSPTMGLHPLTTSCEECLRH